MPSSTFTVRGHKIRTQTNRRYVVISVRPGDVVLNGERYVAFASIIKRTDNYGTARKEMNRFNSQRNPALGYFAVVVDTATGEEIT